MRPYFHFCIPRPFCIDVGFRFVQPLCFATLPAGGRRGSACSFLFLLLPFVLLLFCSCLAVSIFHIFFLLAHTLFVYTLLPFTQSRRECMCVLVKPHTQLCAMLFSSRFGFVVLFSFQYLNV